jgi:ankyrin repeat protein
MDKPEQLFQAIMRGDLDAVRALVAEDTSLANATTPSGVSAVLFAMYYNEPHIIRFLLEHGAQVDIFAATAIGITGRVKALLVTNPELANGTAVDGFSPLGLAAFFGRTEIVELLLKSGAEVNRPSANPQRVMPLHSAVAGQHFKVAQILIAHGADVNASQAEDFTPLQAAAANGQAEMVRLLLDHGADPSARTKDGRSALDMAQALGHAEVVEILKGGVR